MKLAVGAVRIRKMVFERERNVEVVMLSSELELNHIQCELNLGKKICKFRIYWGYAYKTFKTWALLNYVTLLDLCNFIFD